jgi:hypothetical protein
MVGNKFEIMKYLTLILAVAAALESAALAGPLQRTDVATDAKWVLHLDVDQLRSTPQGAYVFTNIVDTALAIPIAVLKKEIGSDLDFTRIHSLTAYGNYFRDRDTNAVGILLVKTDLSQGDLEKVMDAFVAKLKQDGNIGSPPIGKSVQDGAIFYTLKDHSFMVVRPDGTLMESKSAEGLSRANDVLSGKAPNLSSSSAFTEFPAAQNAFFFFGGVEGLDAGDDDGHGNNPKAKILKMADSGCLIVGQDGDQVFLDAALKAKTSGVVTKMQQAIQGLIAIASLSSPDDSDVQQMAESAKVSTHGQIVSLNLDFPADKAVSLLQSNVVKHLMQQNERERMHDREREQRGTTNAPGTTN